MSGFFHAFLDWGWAWYLIGLLGFFGIRLLLELVD